MASYLSVKLKSTKMMNTKTLLPKILLGLVLTLFVACGGGSTENAGEKYRVKKSDKEAAPVDNMSNKGIGPVKSVIISDGIDAELAASGEDVFGKMCSACHKIDKKFVGPMIAGVTERRTPEWIMNMIMNPQEMIKEDPIAKQLLIESNMAVMANQNISREDSRAILEYFRQIDNQ